MGKKRGFIDVLRGGAKTEYSRDLKKTERIARNLQDVAGSIKLTKHRDLNFYIQPIDELRDKEYACKRKYGPNRSKDFTPRNKVRVAQSDQATGFYFGSSVWSEFRSHRIIIGNGGSIDYCRQSFDIDGLQTLTPPIELLGPEAIAYNNEALAELLWLDEHIAGKHPHDCHDLGRIVIVACQKEVI